jgi:biopolymer transport protein ExbD
MSEEKAPLSPAQHSAIRRLVAAASVRPQEEGAELNVVPFLDIITNVLMFVLATLPAVFTSTIPATAPEGRRGDLHEEHALSLTLLITDGALDLKASGANVATGCEGPGVGPTLPNAGGAYRWSELRACAERIRREASVVDVDRSIRILADPGIPYETVIRAIDIVRTDTSGAPLFDDARFGVAR